MNKSNSDDMHERILRSALEVFSNKGYSVATIKDVSAHAKCNSITIFRHFEDKESLFCSVVKRYHKLAFDADYIKSKLSYTNVHADFVMMADLFFEILYENLHILRIFINDGPYFAKIAKYIWYLPAPVKSFVCDYINTIYPDIIAPPDVMLISEMFVAFVTRTCLRQNVHEGVYEYTSELAEEAREVMDVSVDMIIELIRKCVGVSAEQQ